MPARLDRLLSIVDSDIDEIVSEMVNGTLDAGGFRELMEETIVEHHMSAAMVAYGTDRLDALPSEALAKLERVIDFHLEKLDNFTQEIEETGWLDRYAARARMYGRGIKASYGVGETRGYEMPYYPAQGTECMTNCGCEWVEVVVSEATESYNYWWRRAKDDSCNTCLAREAEYPASRPYRIRFGEAA